jgi:modulator of FtsH protease
MDPYQPDQWHDFFLATADAAAALAGLLFVALSLHMRYIATKTVYREMARGSLIALVVALVLSLLVLVRQPVRWLGVEAAFGGFAYLAFVGGQQLFSLQRRGWHIPRERLGPSIGGYLLGLIGLATGIGISLQIGPGLYAVAAIVVAIMLWSLWDAWVLVVGVADKEIEDEKKAG